MPWFKKCFFLLILFMSCYSGKDFVTKPSKGFPIIGDKIRLTGAYYAIYKNQNNNQPELGYFFFYSNSVALFEHAGSVNIDSINNIGYIKKNIANDINFKKSFFNSKNAGGIGIDSDRITIQVFRYIPSLSWTLCTFKGNILNDSSLYIYSCKMGKRPDYCRDNFHLKFIAMIKPDSTNQLMKKSWYWAEY